MEWGKVESSDKGINIPPNWLLLHYYEALSILFRVENALRSFVYIILKNSNGVDWVNITIQSDDASQTTISSLAKKRINQTKNYGYLGYRINSPICILQVVNYLVY